MRKEGTGNGAATHPWHLLVAVSCAVLCAFTPHFATAETTENNEAEQIYRLTHYDLTMNSVATGSLAGAPRLVYYADMDWNAGAGQPVLPDRLEAADARMEPSGIVHATNGTVYINSLIENRTITAQADSIEYDTSDGKALLSGNVVIELAGANLRLDCTSLEYDPLMERLEVAGVEVNVPLDAFMDEEQLQGGAPRAVFGGHFYFPMPDHFRMTSGRAKLDINPLHSSYVLYDTTLSHNDIEDPDLYIHADELELLQYGRMVFTNISLNMSGLTVASWPHFSYSIDRQKGLYDLREPKIRFDKDVGIAWKQGLDLDFGNAYGRAMFDYSPEYGLRNNYRLFITPMPGSRLGVEYGISSEYDIYRVTVERRTDYNFRYQQYINGDDRWFRDMNINVEYGEMTAIRPKTPDEPATSADDERLFADGVLEFPLIPLGNDWYITSGMTGRYVKYFDAGLDYRTIGGFGGFIWRQGYFDHFVVYRSHQVTDTPLFSFDEIRGRELDLMTSFRLHPDYRHVIRGIYNVDDDELNQLAVSILKRQKSYEIGLFWDFARESAGLELGLLVD